MRNQRIDLFKCIAIYCVVFLHIKTGRLDWAVTALTRFAVPYFFLVAGYFAYGQTEQKLLRRARHSLVLWAEGVGLVFVLCAAMVRRNPEWSVWVYLQQQFTPRAWAELLTMQLVPFPHSYHLWFIGAMPLLYGIWWAVTRLCRRAGRRIPAGALAAAGICLLGVHLLLGEGAALLGRDSVPAQYLRNAWMDGLPFFLLGVGMHEKEAEITSRLSKGPILAGLLLSGGAALAEQYLAGMQELFAGSILFALLLLAAGMKWGTVRQNPAARWMCFCGSSLTFYIYMLHVPMYGFFCEWSCVPLFGWIVDHPPIAAPVVALLSTGLAVGLQRVKNRIFSYSNFPENKL